MGRLPLPEVRIVTGTPPTDLGGVHPERFCERCGGENPIWTAPSPLWNEVMRGGDINGIEFLSVVCPNCFIALAEQQCVASEWRLYAKTVDVELETVTPSGRVWNEETWLWE